MIEDCIAAVEAATARRDRLAAHIEAALADWSLAPVVRALQALRGMALGAAATLIAELGDITRFDNPRQLMAYLPDHSEGTGRRYLLNRLWTKLWTGGSNRPRICVISLSKRYVWRTECPPKSCPPRFSGKHL